MGPQRFLEVANGMRDGFAHNSRVVLAGTAAGWHIGVLAGVGPEGGNGFERRTLIANTIEGDDTVAVYDGTVSQSGSMRNPRFTIRFNEAPLMSTLSAEDTARLGELAAKAADEDIVVPAYIGFSSTYPPAQPPNTFRGEPLEPLPGAPVDFVI